MRRLPVLFLFLLANLNLSAGGLVTNTNQGALFTRFQCRDASLDIDAAYYNPAGLVHLSDGYYLSVSNQTIGQVKLITNDYSNLGSDPREYRGKVSQPVFPGLFGVYKRGKLAFSAAVIPVAGDGKSRFIDGLPSYEMALADNIPLLQTRLATVDNYLTQETGDVRTYSDIVGYKSEISIETSSLSMGYQANVAFQINEYLSVAAGARLVNTRKLFKGSVTDFIVLVRNNLGETTEVSASDHLRTAAEDYSTVDDTSAVGLTTISLLNAIADQVDLKYNLETDVVMSGFGLTPVISINYAPSLMTNWSFKYEFRTGIDLKTRIIDGKDGNGAVNEGTAVSADIPAMISLGLTHRTGPRFMFYTGMHYYFDKPVDFAETGSETIELIDNNTYEFAFGGEYQVNNKYRLSCGWLMSRPGVNADYQTEERYALPSNTIGSGLGLRLTPLIDLNLGASYTLYKKGEKDYVYDPEDGVNTPETVTEYYDIRKWIVSVGLDFLFGEM